MTAPATPTPPPGSPEAVAQGCLCGVPERPGDVFYYVRVVPHSTWYVYINPACPLHGTGAQPDAEKAGRE